jgi:predicted nucleic acid-binding protein
VPFVRRPIAFDAVLAAAALAAGADALVSADRTFASVKAINHVVPGTPAFDRLLAG